MTCFKPLTGYYSRDFNHNGNRYIVFNRSQALDPRNSLSIPCGQCIGCRLEKSRQWAVRCVFESQMYDENCFLTLTYDDEHLPSDGSLQPDDLQKFLKRLRKVVDLKEDKKIRFFACGEYGEKFQRPHFHVIVFGWKPKDGRIIGRSRVDGSVYTISDTLSAVWKYGYHIVGDVSFESCAYVARYVTKKITGKQSDEHYDGRQPEFCRMSRRPGIGADWFSRYSDDVYPHDYIIIRDGIKTKPPKFFDRLFEKIHPDEMELLRIARAAQGRDAISHDLDVRDISYSTVFDDYHSSNDVRQMAYQYLVLPVKETVQRERAGRLKRGYEGG